MQTCIDYNASYRMIVKNNYFLPKANDLLDRLAGTTHFSCINLKLGYKQIKVTSEDVHKSTLQTCYSLYELFVMPFGLYNASSTFMSIINGFFPRRDG